MLMKQHKVVAAEVVDQDVTVNVLERVLWVSLVRLFCSTLFHLILISSRQSLTTIKSMILFCFSLGPQGFPGIPGDRGIKGPLGRPGKTGFVGEKGDRGQYGNKGERVRSLSIQMSI